MSAKPTSEEAKAPKAAKEPTKDEVQAMIAKRITDLGGEAAITVDSELTEADFTACATFDGTRTGQVFQNGKFGVGYYVDKTGQLLQRMKYLEDAIGVTKETAIAAKLEAAAAQAPAPTEPEGIPVEVAFTQPKWGMTTRMSGGPVVVTKLKEEGEAKAVGLQVGDELVEINKIKVTTNRNQALAELRKGGAASCRFARPDKPSDTLAVAGVMPAAATTTTLAGDMSPGEMQQLQSMLGNSKGKGTVVIGGQTGVTETITDGKFDSSATLVFANCKDCVYTLENYSMKIYVQDCHNFTLNANTKVLTSTVEIFKGSCCTLNINTDCGTLQADQVAGLKVQYLNKERFTMLVWAGCDPLDVGFAEGDETLSTGFGQVSAEYKDAEAELSKDRSQFKISMVNGKLSQERVIRLQNGFATTMREKSEFEKKQEENLAAMAKTMGISIKPGNKGIKCKPNDLCPCGNGKKFKKCFGCFSPDGYYKADGIQASK